MFCITEILSIMDGFLFFCYCFQYFLFCVSFKTLDYCYDDYYELFCKIMCFLGSPSVCFLVSCMVCVSWFSSHFVFRRFSFYVMSVLYKADVSPVEFYFCLEPCKVLLAI